MSPGARAGGPIRLLWLIDSLTAGGAEALVAPFARALDPARVRLHVCCLKSIGGNPFEAELRAGGVPVTNLGSRHLRDLPAFLRLLRLIRGERIDLVHAHLTYAAIWGVVAARLAGCPCLATLHVAPPVAPAWSRPGLRERLMCRLLEKWGAGVIAVSDAVREAYVRRGRIDPGRISVVRNGVECDRFSSHDQATAEEVRGELGFPPRARLVTTVSVLREGKGVDVLLAAAAEVSGAVADAHFLVAGDGPARESLAARAAASLPGDRVRWLGFRRDIPRLLAASELFVLPSREDALPTAVLEAMAAALPVVATAVGGLPELVEPGRTGWLVPPGDATALAAAVTSALRRPEESRAMGEEGRRRACAEFSSAAWARRLEAAYARALARELEEMERR